MQWMLGGRESKKKDFEGEEEKVGMMHVTWKVLG